MPVIRPIRPTHKAWSCFQLQFVDCVGLCIWHPAQVQSSMQFTVAQCFPENTCVSRVSRVSRVSTASEPWQAQGSDGPTTATLMWRPTHGLAWLCSTSLSREGRPVAPATVAVSHGRSHQSVGAEEGRTNRGHARQMFTNGRSY